MASATPVAVGFDSWPTTFEADPDAVVSNRPPIKPGTRLVRQWKEQVHVVEVETEGYEYRGARYENLSEIARLSTGTRWFRATLLRSQG